MSKWTKLSDLTLYGNEFQRIDSEIFSMQNLERLIITDVNLEPNVHRRPLPKTMNLPNLTSLVLRNCSFDGDISSSIEGLKFLKYLDLSFNKLTGSVPSSLWNKQLKMELTENQLHFDKVPQSLLNQSNFNVTGDFTYNNFSIEAVEGKVNNRTYFKPNRTTIYKEMKKCPRKKSKRPYSLFINCGGSEEKIDGRHFVEDNSTSKLVLSEGWGYSCAGEFPAQVATASDYIQIKTCGAPVIDAPLYTKARQCPTSLRYYGFCLRKGKYNVTLHFIETELIGMEDYSILAKRIFDVYIQGQLIWKDFNIKEQASSKTNVSVVYNHTQVDESGLLEIHFFWAGKGSYVGPSYSINGPLVAAIEVTPLFHVGLRPWQIPVIITSSALFLLFLLAFLLWWIGFIGDKKLREKSMNIRGKSYTIKQVAKGTDNFSTKNEIGKGNFGTVYKSQLPRGGPVVAVKKLFTDHTKKSKMKEHIEREIYTLTHLKHDNIVDLFGGYSDPTRNLHLLVYEYMENNSLSDVLFDPSSEYELRLNWDHRYKICIGMAKGLEYLHNSRLAIVHRNIKSNNILLDGTFNPKITDMGLAKVFEDENPLFSINSTELRFYRAPEYALRDTITDKADVYSFGVILLEIVSGQKNAIYKDAQESEFLLDKAYDLEKKRKLIDLVDGKLVSDDRTYKRNQAIKVLELAMMCLVEAYKLRPTMSQVVAVLEDELPIDKLHGEITPYP